MCVLCVQRQDNQELLGGWIDEYLRHCCGKDYRTVDQI